MRDAYHKLALGLPHYTCGVATGTVAVGWNSADWLLYNYVIMSIDSKSYWRVVVLLNMLGYPHVIR